ncbi:MAG: MATE family efflux transporter [Flavonifractor plautii]
MKRSFFQYVSLNVLGALGLSGYILADTLFVAHRLGTDGLAALNLAISVFGLINGLGLMLGIGGATRYAICRTQGDGVRADRAFSRALACGGTLGGLLALAGLLWAVPLARLLGAEGAILPMCSVYLRTVLFFAPCFLLNHILTAFVRNDRQSQAGHGRHARWATFPTSCWTMCSSTPWIWASSARPWPPASPR